MRHGEKYLETSQKPVATSSTETAPISHPPQLPEAIVHPPTSSPAQLHPFNAPFRSPSHPANFADNQYSHAPPAGSATPIPPALFSYQAAASLRTEPPSQALTAHPHHLTHPQLISSAESHHQQHHHYMVQGAPSAEGGGTPAYLPHDASHPSPYVTYYHAPTPSTLQFSGEHRRHSNPPSAYNPPIPMHHANTSLPAQEAYQQSSLMPSALQRPDIPQQFSAVAGPSHAGTDLAYRNHTSGQAGPGLGQPVQTPHANYPFSTLPEPHANPNLYADPGHYLTGAAPHSIGPQQGNNAMAPLSPFPGASPYHLPMNPPPVPHPMVYNAPYHPPYHPMIGSHQDAGHAGAPRVEAPTLVGVNGVPSYPQMAGESGGAAVPTYYMSSEGVTHYAHPLAPKKRRLQWTTALHERFVSAVNELGTDTAVPKLLLQAMNVPGLTRENVASHLQKYRESIRRKKIEGSGSCSPAMQAGNEERKSLPAAEETDDKTPPEGQERLGEEDEAGVGKDAVKDHGELTVRKEESGEDRTSKLGGDGEKKRGSDSGERGDESDRSSRARIA